MELLNLYDLLFNAANLKEYTHGCVPSTYYELFHEEVVITEQPSPPQNATDEPIMRRCYRRREFELELRRGTRTLDVKEACLEFSYPNFKYDSNVPRN